MNKTDVITRVSRTSGISADVCAEIIDAFEKQAGEALVNKFKGIRNDRASLLKGIAQKTGLVPGDCEIVLKAFEEVLDAGLSDKLKFFK
jgi:nucleoid DNA-binding protein